MDLQSFIQSGLLEAYVAGQCTASERQEVDQMVSQHPEIRAELDKIERALEQLALANAIEPPPGLKNRILDQLEKEPLALQRPDMPTATVASTGRSNVRLYQVLTLIGAVLASFFFWRSMFLSAEKEQLNNKVIALQTQVDDCAKRREHTEPMAKLLRDTDTHPVKVTDGKAYNITVYTNDVRQECALDISGVPVPAPGKYLQAWGIVDGVPVSLGMVQLNALGGWQPLPYKENIQAFAISEESNPQGNPTPTVVIAMGKLQQG